MVSPEKNCLREWKKCMDKIGKFLKKLNKKEFVDIMSAVDQILSNSTKGLDVKKLSGQKDIFRARVGDLRIIFLKKESDIEVLEISRRSEKTYKKY